MEQKIQQQSPQQPIIPQNNRNKTITAVVVNVLIAILVVGAGVYFFTTRGSNKIAEQQNTQNPIEPMPTPTNNTSTRRNPKDYSLVDYPLKQSSVYSQLDKDCLSSYWSDAKDTRLIKNQTEILIPSLLQVISSSENQKPNCAMSVSVFSAPADEKYLYLQTSYNTGSSVTYSGLSGLYRLDLSTLSIKKLAITEFLSTTDLYRGFASDSYELLADGKRLVKWSMSGVYLINLETDS